MRKNLEFKFRNNDFDIAYLLGIFLSKARVDFKRRTFTVKSVDKEVCERVQVACKLLFDKDYFIKDGENFYSIEVGHRTLFAWLVGVTDNKDIVPNLVYKQSHDWKREFMAGVLDGSGWVSVSEDRKDKKKNSSWWITIGVSGPSDGYIKNISSLLSHMNIPFRHKTESKMNKVQTQLLFYPDSFLNSGLYFYSMRKQSRLNEL